MKCEYNLLLCATKRLEGRTAADESNLIQKTYFDEYFN